MPKETKAKVGWLGTIIDEAGYFEETGRLFPLGVTTRKEAEAFYARAEKEREPEFINVNAGKHVIKKGDHVDIYMEGDGVHHILLVEEVTSDDNGIITVKFN